MLRPALYVVGALAFLLADPGSALTAKQANSVCALLPEGDLIANPINCKQYYSCGNKGKAILNSCLGNMLFSKEHQACLPPHQVSCGPSEKEDPCTYVEDGHFLAVPNSCKKYIYCFNGVGTQSTCDKDKNFDEETQFCKYESEYPCTESNLEDLPINICEVVQSGKYFGSSTSCSAWQKCQYNNGPPISNICSQAPNKFFNVDTANCDSEDNVDCRQTKGMSILAGTPCSKNGEFKADGTCAGYYVCTNFKYAFKQCTNGQYFNPLNNKCVSRLDAVNDCDRCQGTKMNFVNDYQDGCTGYIPCKDGKAQPRQECIEGFFDEREGGCVKYRKIEFPVCYIQPDAISPSNGSKNTPTKSDKKGKENKPKVSGVESDRKKTIKLIKKSFFI